MAYGFIPIRTLDGSPMTGALRKATLTAAAVVYGKGDPLEMDAAGTLSRAEAADVQTIGVLQYMEWTDATGNFHQDNYIAATTGLTVTAYYIPVENIVFKVIEDGDTTPLAATDVGLNCAMIVADANATTKLSGTMLDSSEAATTSTDELRILALHTKVGNAIGNTAGTVEWEVTFNARHGHAGSDGI